MAGFASVVLALGGLALANRSQRGMGLPGARPLFVIGDSLSAGIGPSHEGTWPHLLAAELGIRVTNLARAGSTLSGGVSQAGLLPRTPMVVLIELGGNDLLGGVPRARFAADLRALLSAVVDGDRSVVMFELPLLPFQNGYGRIQRAVCAEYGVNLVPRHVLAAALAKSGDTTDGLHLSAEGQASLARRIAVLWRIDSNSVPKRK